MNDSTRSSARSRVLDGAIIVAGAVVSLWLVGYFKIDWTKPARLDADHLFLLTWAKALINGHGFRFDAQFGYPDVRDNLYFPGFDLTTRMFMWLVTRFTTNPFLTAHTVYIAGISAMYGLAYWAQRRLDIGRLVSACGGLAFVLTPFLANRIYSHDTLVLAFSVPLGFGLALMIGLSRPDANLKSFLSDPFTVAAILLVGTGGLYYAFFTLMFMAFAGVAASVAQRRWFPLLAAVCSGVPLFILLVFSGFGFDVLTALGPSFSGPHRFAYEQILYGLDLPSMAYPFERLHKVAEGVAQTHAAFPKGPSINEGEGEWPAIPLMLALLGSPLVAAACLGARNFDEAVVSRMRMLGFCAALVVFALLFGARGGLGYMFNLLVTPEIRADGRLMPFLTFAAIVMIGVAAALTTAIPQRWWGWAGQAAACLMLLVSVKPAVGAAYSMMHLFTDGPLPQRLSQSTPLMLAAKNRAGLQTVLELPMANWPESPFFQNLDPYEHQLPYIYDTPGNTTRWSYGATDKQPWFGVVTLATHDPATLVTRARHLGFDSVLIQKRGFEPAKLSALQAALDHQLAPACKLFDDDVEVLYALRRGPNGAAC